MTLWIAAFGLPFVGGLHRYAMSYGYRGVSRAQAWGEAWRVAVILGAIVALCVMATRN
jgi:hypothetical protein